MDNYEYCASFAIEHSLPGARVLDYGCGKGQIVELLRRRGTDAYGCDVFYEGGSYRDVVRPELFATGVIREMEGDRIPFGDQDFDVIVNNQVMEHVPDLNKVLGEINRVMRPGGILLSLFPDVTVWREGHREVPFLHWFPKGRLRVYYCLAFRIFGLGSQHFQLSPMQWSEESCAWIDKWCYYRPYREISHLFSTHFSAPVHIEHHWFDKRYDRLAKIIPTAMKRFIVQKGAGMVFVCTKPNS